MRIKQSLLLAITLMFFIQCNAQIENPVEYKTKHKSLGDNKYELTFEGKIKDTWHLYSIESKQDDPAVIGPMLPYLEADDAESFKIIGDVKETGKIIRKKDKQFDNIDVAYYEGTASFTYIIEVLKPIKEFAGYFESQACSDLVGKCVLIEQYPKFAVEFKEIENTQKGSSDIPEASEFGFEAAPVAASNIEEPVEWTIEKNKIKGSKYEIVFKANVEEGWHIYSAHLKENGPKPTKLYFENAEVEFVTEIEEEGKAHTEFDELFNMEVTYFDGEVTFKQTIEIKGNPNKVEGTIEYMVCSDEKCVPLEEYFDIELGVEATTATESFTSTEMEDKSLVGFFIFAFLMGLLAILMPCVFPMIPMTVSFFMHGSENKRKARHQAMVFSISIIVIFFLLGLVVALTAGPTFTNWLSTHWIPNIFFTLLFLIFAASFFGLFELTLPSWLINKSDKQADKGGLLAPFFMALTLVLVSFSCTVPIIGWVIVEAAKGALLKPIVGMLGFSLAFALPFGFFAFFPSKLSSLPQSGGWLNTVKVVFGFIELALALKFLSVADQTYHWGILPREVYIAFWIVIFALLGLYFLGKLKFAHDSEMKFIPVPRFILGVITLSFVVYLIPGMFGAPLKGLSGYLPPQETHNFDLNAIVRDYTSDLSKVEKQHEGDDLCEAPKYSDRLHLPHGLHGYFELEQALECAKSQNKPLFIDFTGHGCVNCREMEQSVWSKEPVLKRLKNDFVVVALYVDDKVIKLPEDEWTESKRTGRTIKTLSKMNAEIQIEQFGSNSQPYYILLDTDGETVLAPPRGHNKDVDAFVKFLDQGLENFKKRHP